jgi:hypothetical protein
MRIKKDRKQYEFEDLMRVRRAAILTSKILGEQLERFCPEAFCGRLGYRSSSSGTNFITLAEFSSFCIYFKALLPGITKKDMRRILWKVRERRAEFQRRTLRREGYDHMRNKYSYYGYWKSRHTWNSKMGDRGYRGDRATEIHSIVLNRLYPMEPNKYEKFFKAYARRHTKEISDKGTSLRGNLESAYKVQGQLGYNPFQYGQVRFDSNSVIEQVQLKNRDHRGDSVWCAPYKDTNGRAGILMVLQLPYHAWTWNANMVKRVVYLPPGKSYAIIGKPEGIEYTLGIDWLERQCHMKDGGEKDEG